MEHAVTERGFDGRVAEISGRAGVRRLSWKIGDVADQINTIRDADPLWELPSASSDTDHLQRSFEMAGRG